MSLNHAVEIMGEIPMFRNVDAKRLKLFALMSASRSAVPAGRATVRAG